MKKLIIVYNPRASRQDVIATEVLEPARGISGLAVGKFEVTEDPLDENVKTLAGMLEDGDLVVVAGGDGTATMAFNAVIRSGKDVVYAALGYGHFNDVAGMLGVRRPVVYGDEYLGGIKEIAEKFQQGSTAEIYPLEIKVDGRHFRYAACYATLGMAAEAAEMFNGTEMRERLVGGRPRWKSYLAMAMWYLKERKRRFVPDVEGSGELTDVIALNAPRMAHVMRGKKWQKDATRFGAGEFQLRGMAPLFGFMMKSMFRRVPVKEVEELTVEFREPSDVVMQAEGESRRLQRVKKIGVKKTGRPVKVIEG